MFCIEFPQIPPMIVGIWSGDTKPVVNEYVMRFVSELKDILPTEITIHTYRVIVKMGLMIGDTPARSLLKGIYCIFNKKGEQEY